MKGAIAIRSDYRGRDIVNAIAQSALQDALPKCLKILIAQYANDTLYCDFSTMLHSLRVDNLVNECCPALSTSSYTCRRPLGGNPATVETWLIRLHAGEVIDTSVPLHLQVFFEIAPANAELLTDNCLKSFWPAPNIAKELWNFMCGGAPPPALRQALAAHPSGGPDEVVELLRSDLRLKAARWCSMRECAAVARARFG